MHRAARLGLLALVVAGCGGPATTAPATAAPPIATTAAARYVILCIADGWGYKQIEATAHYTGARPVYADWSVRAMSTWDVYVLRGNDGVGYDPNRAWSDFGYAARAAADSASTATAMATGVKTESGRISVGPGGTPRLETLAEIAHAQGRAVGVVTSVPISHATPGAWVAHNDSRRNGCAIADEMLFGAPNATGPPTVDGRRGGHGPTAGRPEVVIGGGHPGFSREAQPYVDMAILERLRAGSDGWRFVERVAGQRDGGARLLAAAADPQTTRLCGLFGGPGGNIEFAGPDGSGHDPENPTLAEMARAALTVLARNPDGFVCMIEGGAVDWGCHANRLDRAVGEMRQFDAMLAAVAAWVDDPATPATWANTLVIVTGDHECGYLTPGPGVFPDQPLGPVTDATLALERVRPNGRRASWADTNGNGEIDAGETVHWAFHTGYHSNHLIPCYARGAGIAVLDAAPAGTDPVRGRYIDNTAVFTAMRALLE